MFGSEKKQFEVPLIPHCDGIIFVNSFNSGHLRKFSYYCILWVLNIIQTCNFCLCRDQSTDPPLIKIIGFSTDDAFKICLDNWQVKLFNMNIPEGMNE